MIVADTAVAVQDLVDQFLPVDRVFQRHPDIVVVERCRPRVHGEGVVLRPGRRQHLEVAGPLQQVDGVQVDLVDNVDLAGHQGVLARRRVENAEQFQSVDVGPALFPVIRVALQ